MEPDSQIPVIQYPVCRGGDHGACVFCACCFGRFQKEALEFCTKHCRHYEGFERLEDQTAKLICNNPACRLVDFYAHMNDTVMAGWRLEQAKATPKGEGYILEPKSIRSS